MDLPHLSLWSLETIFFLSLPPSRTQLSALHIEDTWVFVGWLNEYLAVIGDQSPLLKKHRKNMYSCETMKEPGRQCEKSGKNRKCPELEIKALFWYYMTLGNSLPSWALFSTSSEWGNLNKVLLREHFNSLLLSGKAGAEFWYTQWGPVPYKCLCWSQRG